jgi:hypothetical protein
VAAEGRARSLGAPDVLLAFFLRHICFELNNLDADQQKKAGPGKSWAGQLSCCSAGILPTALFSQDVLCNRVTVKRGFA